MDTRRSASPVTAVDVGRVRRRRHRCWPRWSCAASSAPRRWSRTYTLRAGSARLDIALRHRLARGREAALADGAARRARPRGGLRHPVRPRHAPDARQQPWDAAKFEVCAHRFVDLSEPSFGCRRAQRRPLRARLFRTAASASRCCAPRSTPTPTRTTAGTPLPSACCRTAPGCTTCCTEADALNVPLRVVHPARAAASPPPVVAVDHRGRADQQR